MFAPLEIKFPDRNVRMVDDELHSTESDMSINKKVSKNRNALSLNESSWKEYILLKASLLASKNHFKHPPLNDGEILIHNDYKVFTSSEITSLCRPS